MGQKKREDAVVVAEQWNLLPFLEKLFDEIIKWVKIWWGEEFSDEVSEEIGGTRRSLMSPWYAPLGATFIEGLRIKPGKSPEQWLNDTVLFLERQGAETNPRFIINAGDLRQKGAVINGFVRDLPINLTVMLFKLTTSTPACSDLIEDVSLLMQLRQYESTKRPPPRKFIDMLRARSLDSILDIDSMLPPPNTDRVDSREADGTGEGLETKTPPGQYL